ncbi:hypothetical protein HOO54_22560 [Bacillus sp. WMMC1349]|uniref:hypothetical protein n=1 Tax=Bacillus sp. WMMC1349 TaxID=2736254 RepID=UPI0015545A9B|nr:hypothetical protein [Bacillus sp. WMMC1349]NPC94918.1 hypothetical protein [Bacillus sp. WMMC1349]
MKLKNIMILCLAALSLIFILILSFHQKSTQDIISEQFSEYVGDNHLTVLRETIPQQHEKVLLSVYKTPENQFGIIEFGEEQKAQAEKNIDNRFTVIC